MAGLIWLPKAQPDTIKRTEEMSVQMDVHCGVIRICKIIGRITEGEKNNTGVFL